MIFCPRLLSLMNEFLSQRSHSSRNIISQPLEKVWEEGYTGKGVTVIVIDNGVRGTHRELASRYVSYNFYPFLQ